MKTLVGIPRPTTTLVCGSPNSIRFDALESMRARMQTKPRGYVMNVAEHLRACGCSRKTTLQLSLEANRVLDRPIWVQEVLRIVAGMYPAQA
jgi:hypothetical protein